MGHRAPLGWTLAATAWLAIVVAADLLAGDQLTLPALLALAPIIVSYRGSPALTLVFGAAAVAAAMFLGIVDADVTTLQHWVVIGFIVVVATAAYAIARLQQSLAAAFRRAEQLATWDQLTDVLTRHAFIDRFQQMLAIRPPERPPLALGLVDVDRFKQINDRHGHLIGDAVLAAVGHRLAVEMRAGDLIGRYGGEEFVVAVVGDPGDTATVMERLAAQVREEPVDTAKGAIRVTISAGWTTVEDDDADAGALLARADSALYVSKRRGRDRVTVWLPELAADRAGGRDRPAG